MWESRTDGEGRGANLHDALHDRLGLGVLGLGEHISRINDTRYRVGHLNIARSGGYCLNGITSRVGLLRDRVYQPSLVLRIFVKHNSFNKHTTQVGLACGFATRRTI